MSKFADYLALFETTWRTAVPTLPAAEDGWDDTPAKGGETLATNQLPHVFAIAPQRVKEPAGDFLQYTEEFRVEFNLWPSRATTQEEASEMLDAFEDALATDPTLGGVFRHAWCSIVGFPRDMSGRTERVGIVFVTAQRDL